jgi:hypothetical protein
MKKEFEENLNIYVKKIVENFAAKIAEEDMTKSLEDKI